MTVMPPADDAGPLALRVDYPVPAGKIFAYVFFPVLAAPLLFLLVQELRSPADSPSRSLGLAIFGALLALVVAGFLVTLRLLARRPTALEVREKALVLFFGSRVETIEWPAVKGVEQGVAGVVPGYWVLLQNRPNLAVGMGDRGQELARLIVQRAGLRWIHEPFSARRFV